MDDCKFAFIICFNNEQYLNECIYYINGLYIPEGFSVDVISVQDAESMCAGYNAAMNSSDAKYKVYLHQDTFIVNRNFIQECLDAFSRDSSIAMLGSVGVSKLPKDGFCVADWDTGTFFNSYILKTIQFFSFSNMDNHYVEAVDGFFMVTNQDLHWREDVFKGFDYYDVSQAVEFRRMGYRVVVPYQEEPWCVHDSGAMTLINYDKYRKIFCETYHEDCQFKVREKYQEEIGFEIGWGERLPNALNKVKEYFDRGELEEAFREVDSFYDSTLSSNEINRIIILREIYQAEKKNGRIFFFEPELDYISLMQKLQALRFLLIRVEHDRPQEDYSLIFELMNDEKISLHSLSVLIEHTCCFKEKVVDILSGKRRTWKPMPSVEIKKMETENGYTIGRASIDLTAVSERDVYSEGDIENELLEIAKEGRISEALHSDDRWSILYHFTEVRENLLSWLPEDRSKSVLEIGSGCGAVTGALCRVFGSVDCVELSERRAEIAAWRWAECDNLKIHVGNLNDMHFPEKFDVVTLIGVLEYAASFTHDTGRPYQNFLLNCKSYLKDSGTLIIAIENRIGLKYWAGAWEDHTGDIFDGLLGYPEDKGVKTFSKKELSVLLDEVGLTSKRWYYPYPDYKLPAEIYSDRREPTVEEMRYLPNNTYDRERYEFFSEKEAMASLLSTGLFPEFSNSYLVFCGGKFREEMILPDYCHYSSSRRPEFRVSTEILERNGRKVVRKTALTREARNHIRTILRNYEILSYIYGPEHVASSRLIDEGVLEMDFIEGTSMSEVVFSSLKEQGVEGLEKQLEFLLRLAPSYLPERLGLPDSVTHPERVYDVDLNFDNIIFKDGDFILIDYEWLLNKVPEHFLEYRCLTYFYHRYRQELSRYGISLDTLLVGIGVGEKEVKECDAAEKVFLSLILDEYNLRYKKNRIGIQ